MCALRRRLMTRIVVIAFLALAAWVLAARLMRSLKERRIDWTGIAFFIGFVALAFYLRHVTGIG